VTHPTLTAIPLCHLWRSSVNYPQRMTSASDSCGGWRRDGKLVTTGLDKIVNDFSHEGYKAHLVLRLIWLNSQGIDDSYTCMSIGKNRKLHMSFYKANSNGHKHNIKEGKVVTSFASEWISKFTIL
jgi:hypothetical protein